MSLRSTTKRCLRHGETTSWRDWTFNDSISALQIYNEKVVDLLSKSQEAPLFHPGESGAYVDGLTSMELQDDCNFNEVSLLSIEPNVCIMADAMDMMYIFVPTGFNHQTVFNLCNICKLIGAYTAKTCPSFIHLIAIFYKTKFPC